MNREIGCGDNSCRCFKNLELNTLIVAAGMSETTVPYDNREQVAHLRHSVMTLLAEYRKLKKDYDNF